MHRIATPSFSLPKHNYDIPLSKRFPQDIQCIIYSNNPDYGSLYISNIEAAQNPNTIKRYRITAVLSCAKGYQLRHDKNIVPHYKYIPTIDHQNCDISVHFERAIDFIAQHLKKTNVLVHCIAGISRSVSMVIAYLIKQHSMSYEEAYILVKSRRNIINPNQGFKQQLKRYHREISSKSERNYQQRDVSLQRVRKQQQNEFLKRSITNQIYSTQTSFKTYGTIQRSSKDKYKRTKYEYLHNDIPRQITMFQLNSDKAAQGYNFSPARSQAKTKQHSIQHTRYYSPTKVLDKQYKYHDTYQKMYKDKGYFKSVSNQLDDKIQKIKQKYDVQRKNLQNRYQAQSQAGGYFLINAEKKAPYLQATAVKSKPSYKSIKIKTQAQDRYPRSTTYITPTKYEKQMEKLFPKKFYSGAVQKETIRYQNYNNKDKSERVSLNNSRYKNVQAQQYKDYQLPRTYTNNSTKYENLYNRTSNGYKKYP